MLVQPPGTALAFYAVCAGEPALPYPIYRSGRTQIPLEQSIEALLLGTSESEQAQGLFTAFDGFAEAPLVNVETFVDPNGVVRVELLINEDPWLPDTGNWSSSQLLSLLDPLLATVFSSAPVTAIDMSTLCFEQIACDRVVTRAEWAGMLFTNTGALTHKGCTPEAAWGYPELCTVQGILAGPTLPGAVANVAADDVLNVRSGPGAEFFIIGRLDQAARVAATDEAAVADDGGIWRLIVDGDDQAGWVNQAYLDVARTGPESVAEAFVQFAGNPGDAAFSVLPLADRVAFGLGPRIVKTVSAGELRSPAAWQLDVENFRAYVGPFSAFEALGRLQVYEVMVGEHQHCASPPVAPPEGYENHRRISVQPRLGLQASCLMWNSVDFFVDLDGNVAAITLDLWEP